MSQALDTLRERIRAIEGRPAEPTRWDPVGLPVWDAEVGGLPRPGAVVLTGALGSGCTRLALSLVAALTRAGEGVAWVDPHRSLHPPAAFDLGVVPSQVLLVRPSETLVGWSVEQILRAGGFGLVVVSSPPSLPGLGARWTRAARLGGTTLLVIDRQVARPSLPDLDTRARVIVREGTARVLRRRGRRPGAAVDVPADAPIPAPDAPSTPRSPWS